jgi:tetratricopeptide (TPR) repeat protein
MRATALLVLASISFPAQAKNINIELEPALATKILVVEAQILNRQFAEAVYSCTDLFFPDRTFPLNLICQVLVVESAMFDREDFHREEEFKSLASAVKSALSKRADSQNVWMSLFTGAFWGMVGLHDLRKHSFYLALKNGYKGLQETKRVLTIDPYNQDVYLGLGIYDYYSAVLSRQLWWFPFALGDRRQGVSELTRAAYASVIAKDPAQLMLAYFYYSEKRFAESSLILEVLLKKYPNNSMAGVLMARIHLIAGKANDAIFLLNSIRQKIPEHSTAPLFLGEAYYLKGEMEKAEGLYQQFLAHPLPQSKKADGYFGLAKVHHALHQKEKTQQYLQLARKADSRKIWELPPP